MSDQVQDMSDIPSLTVAGPKSFLSVEYLFLAANIVVLSGDVTLLMVCGSLCVRLCSIILAQMFLPDRSVPTCSGWLFQQCVAQLLTPPPAPASPMPAPPTLCGDGSVDDLRRCVGADLSADRPHPAQLDKQGRDVILLVQRWTKNRAACCVARVHSSLCTWTLLKSILLQVDVGLDAPVQLSFDDSHRPDGNIIILLQEVMSYAAPYLLDQGKSALALQAKSKAF